MDGQDQEVGQGWPPSRQDVPSGAKLVTCDVVKGTPLLPYCRDALSAGSACRERK
ncbi:MAG: hypothetical protein ABGY24_03450 [bacterium]